jgi:hypothetical protein
VALSPDGRRVATAGKAGTVRLWDAASGREIRTLRGHGGSVYCLAFSPDGSRLAIGGAGGTVRLWDAAGGRPVLTLRGHTKAVHRVTFSPDGKQLASDDGDDTVKVWDAASAQELLSFRCLAGGGRVAVVDDAGVVRAADDDRFLSEVESRVAFSPDGRRLASAGLDKMVSVWDVAAGRQVLALKGHTGPVAGVAWSLDGKRLASAGGDGTVRVWDAASGREVLTLKSPTPPGDSVRSVAFSPDGKRLACLDQYGMVQVWEGLVSAEDRRRRDIVRLVRERFDALLLRSEVLASLRREPALDAWGRAFALEVAQNQQQEEDPGRLDEAAWRAVSVPGRGRDAYALALRQLRAAAKAGAEGAPDPLAWMRSTKLAVTYYRLGEYAKALDTLQKYNLTTLRGDPIPSSGRFRPPGGASQKPTSTTLRGDPIPTGLAFRAMTQYQLGQKAEAQKTLRRLREVMRQPDLANNAECRAFLREAEELLRAKAKNAPK